MATSIDSTRSDDQQPALDGRVAVVTGSSAGIGLAVVERLLECGANVVVNSRTQERADAAARAFDPAHVHPVAADLGTADGVERLFSSTLARFGTVDILVNNAGMSSAVPAVDLAPADWQRVIDLNLTAPFLCAQAAARVMLPAGRGVIVNVSSILGHRGMARRTAYCTAKHGLLGMTKALASEWGPQGLRVVSVDPGYVATELVAELVSDGRLDEAVIRSRTPLGRLGEPSEIADFIAFVASDRAAFINGSNLVIDGGWTADAGWPS